ncbi:hypothetical protein SCHPADRAFT_940236 [Schizopora paradoxa]|uniref:Uncharacterized protein n=1 Tax=Schizopora paradoxa TaxID=27342 RepID=A0A0H2RNZ1_9AGAM|nr:hypothetical protein SCHPADRAFT_940236 [Schizopora paradoxa]
MTPEEKRELLEDVSKPFVPTCICVEVEEEYQSLLRGAKMPIIKLKCPLHPKSSKRMPPMKRHPIPERLAHLVLVAYREESGPEPTTIVDQDALLDLDAYIQKLRGAGFKLKKTRGGIRYLVDMLDPYGVLAGEPFPTIL